MTGDVSMNSNGFLKIPVGTDAQQPGQSNQPAAAIGQFRYNSDQNRFEGYKNTDWGAWWRLGATAVAQIGCSWRHEPNYYNYLQSLTSGKMRLQYRLQ